MIKFPVIAFAALIAAAGLAAPALASTHASAQASAAPSCPNGDSANYDYAMDTLSTQLHLSAKPGSSIDMSSGCIEVTTIKNGKTTMAFYDPDTLSLVSKIG